MTKRTLALMAVLACGAGPLCATISYIAQPTSGYVSGTMLLPISQPEGDIISTESDSTLTITFLGRPDPSSAFAPELMDVDSVPDNWLTWGSPPNTESSTPMVLDSDDSFPDIELQFSLPLSTFGVELEPNDTAGADVITVTFLLGGSQVGEIQQSVSGNGGALLFAATGAVFDSVEVSSDVDVGMAQFRYVAESSSATPEPSAGMLAFVGLASVAGLRFARRARHLMSPLDILREVDAHAPAIYLDEVHGAFIGGNRQSGAKRHGDPRHARGQAYLAGSGVVKI
jgi:hypothetical protein